MLLGSSPARLIAMTGLTNLAFRVWPAAIVRVRGSAGNRRRPGAAPLATTQIGQRVRGRSQASAG
jgi:hypothetical protein